MVSESAHIHILKESVARKIAAGEVIDRPAAVVRELLDNSLDAEAANVDIHLEAGGNDLIRVTDDGSGMAREDLELCYLPHATSKIESDQDLMQVRTLGFRGEALGSMAAVSRLTVTSAPRAPVPPSAGGEYTTPPAATPQRLEVHGGKLIGVGPAAGSPGTTVEVANLFYNLPARKRFLKRPQSEWALVKAVLLDRAIAFPQVGFRLFSGSDLRAFLPPAGRVARIAAAYPERIEPALLHSLTGSGDGFTLELVAGEPGAARKDRKHVQVFVNRRRVWEYALVQAVEYAYRDYLHGGLFPVAYLFLTVEPELVDFNIHPAKREVRFRNLPDIHHRIVDVLAGYLRTFDRRAHAGFEPGPSLSGLDDQVPRGPGGYRPGHQQSAGLQRDPWPGAHGSAIPGPAAPGSAAYARSRLPAAAEKQPAYDLTRTFRIPEEPEGFRYLGQIFGLFLVVERGDTLYLVDQHAAHERIIYERLKNGPAGQELLFPVRFEVGEDEHAVLLRHREELAGMGIGVEPVETGNWQLSTVPAMVDLEAETLVELIQELADRPADFQRELYASISCRAAVMDGDILPRSAAVTIVSSAIQLTNARCPHGRPIWAEFSREELMRLVERI